MLTRWTPMERWLGLPSLFEWPFGEWSAWGGTSVQQTDDGYQIQLALPGFKPEEVEVTLAEGTLRITAKHEEKYESNGSRQRSAFTSSLDRRFTLPEGVTPDDVSASLEDGVLTVRVKHAAGRNQVRIPVTAGQPQLAGKSG